VKGRTTFIITHTVSQSILDFVTRIVVMEQGRIVAVGPHQALIETCPLYQRLYQAQSRQKTAGGTPSLIGEGEHNGRTTTIEGEFLRTDPGVSSPADSRPVTTAEITDSPRQHIIPMRVVRHAGPSDAAGAAS
jgi:ABC-type multidrug transport system ATPase subunit